MISILNEVLSLNAQECVPLNFHQYLFVLNEVLSLNAQESGYPSRRGERNTLLNEVLSLNAQEFFQKFVEAMIMVDSSMKS